jgi:xanthine dehydrogenase large subunit
MAEVERRQHEIVKKGLALTPVKFGISFTLTHLNQAGALVHVYQDGSIGMNHGGTEMGQGLFQKVAQVAAHSFGVPIEAVRVTATDTAKVPNTSATAASSGSDLNGMAVKAACERSSARMADGTSPPSITSASPGDVVFADGAVHGGPGAPTASPRRMRCYEGRVSLSATGFYKTPDRSSGTGSRGAGGRSTTSPMARRCTEVAARHADRREPHPAHRHPARRAGASLNPALDRGQIEGGYVQGAGWLTMEELVWDEAGRLRTHAPSTYKIPACSDAPDMFNVSALGQGAERGATIYRSKAVGEPPFMLGISAFSGAVRRARGLRARATRRSTPPRRRNACSLGIARVRAS